MKIYVKSSTDLTKDIPQVLTMNGVKINYNHGAYTGVYRGGWEAGRWSLKEKRQFISELSSIVAKIFSIEELRKYDLVLSVIVESLHGDDRYSVVQGTLESHKIASQFTRYSGYNEPRIDPDNLPCSHAELEMFKHEVEVYRDYLIRQEMKITKFNQDFSHVPEEVRRAAYEFHRQIVSESLGRKDVDDSGREWLKSRTVNNRRSQTWSSPDKQARGNMLIDALFDWLADTRSTYEDLADLSNQATKYYSMIVK